MASQKGFTLIELLVALVIFVMIGISASNLLSAILHAKSSLDAKSQQLEDLQTFFLVAQHDLMQITPRALAGKPPLDAAQLSFTRQGWSNPLHEPRSSLVRVRYALSGGTVTRELWQAKDIAGERVWAQQLAVHLENAQLQASPNAPGSQLPPSVNLSAMLPGAGEVKQLIPLAFAP